MTGGAPQNRAFGTGSYGAHWCGLLPVWFKTDGYREPDGITRLDFLYHTANTWAPSNQCAGVPGAERDAAGPVVTPASTRWTTIRNTLSTIPIAS